MREALSLPLRRSRLGSLSEGAAEQSEAEGVYFVGCCKPMVFPALCRGRQLGDPQADGTEQNVEWGQLPATTPWLPPGGSCHDEISASRNRYFIVTDEGWRKLKISTVVRWMAKTKTTTTHPAAFKNQPVAAPHQSFLPIGSEAPIVKKSSFPPGEAEKLRRFYRISFIEALCCMSKRATWLPL